MKDQNEGPFLKDENQEMSLAETPDQLVKQAQIESTPSHITVESEDERNRKIDALRSTLPTSNNDWSAAAFKQSNQPAEPFDSKVTHHPIKERGHRGGFFNRLMFSIGLGSMALGAHAKDNNVEKDFLNTGTTKEASVSDSSGHEKPVDKITSINSYGEKVGKLTLEGELLVPYSDTTKQVALIKFAGKENDPNAVANMIEAAHKKGYKLALPGMLEKTIAENPALVRLLDKNRMYVASLGVHTSVEDDTKMSTGISAKITTDTLVNKQGDTTIVKETRVNMTKPELDAIVTYVPGVHRINQNEDHTTVDYNYAIIVYRDLLPENTAVYTDGLTKK